MTSTASRALAIVAAVWLCAGCATTVAGSAIRDPNQDPRAANPALLDPGGYPTKPRPALGNAGSTEVGRQVEARRMGDVVAIPFEVDPSFNRRRNFFPTGPVVDPGGIDGAFLATLGPALAGHDFVAGFSTSGSPAKGTIYELTVALLRFATPADAQAAATEMAHRTERDQRPDLDLPARSPLPVPDDPDTSAVATEAGNNQSWTTLYAYTSTGPFVVAQNIEQPSTEDALKLMHRTVEVQRDLLKGFTPTPVDKLADLPLDPDGLWARTLTAGAASADPAEGLYGTHGALTFMSLPARSQELFTKTGMQTMAKALVNVYRARDPKAAGAIVDDFAAEVSENNFKPSAGVDNLPAARCAVSPPSLVDNRQDYYCLAAVDRYAIEVNAHTESDAHQLMAAQYLMLTAS